MSEWQNENTEHPRTKAVSSLLTSLEQNDDAFLAGEIDKAKYAETAKAIDERLAVAGLRLINRPWERR